MTRPLVILIDDDEAFLGAMRRTLRRQKYELLALNGDLSLLTELSGRVPSVAVVDWHLAHGNASPLIVALTETHPMCPIIVHSGDVRPEERTLAARAGAWRWVSKLEGALLASHVAQALEEGQRRRKGEGMPTMAEIQTRAIVGAMVRFNGNRRRAAENLGLSTAQFYRLRKKLGIEWNDAA
ncbi:MAG: response regulator [Planctomycetota bacterium]